MAEDAEVGSAGSNCDNKTVKKSLSKNLNGATDYLTPDTRQTFTQLRQAFTKTPIVQHFDSKYPIRMDDTSAYAIGEVLSQLTLDNLSW